MVRVERVNSPRGRFIGVGRDEPLDVDSGSNRRRAPTKKKLRIFRGPAKLFDFVNPYPWLSEPEAIVQLKLESLGVPFSTRYFDGESPTLQELMPDFHPEFTLREYNTVIIIIGEFFGTLPGVLDRNALAAALLENDGWRVVILTESEIRTNLDERFRQEMPELGSILGTERDNPYGQPDYMAKRRAQLAGQGFLRMRFRLDTEKQRAQGGSRGDVGRKRMRRIRGTGNPERRSRRRGR